MTDNGVSPSQMSGSVPPASGPASAEAGVSLDDPRVVQAMEEYLKLLQSGRQPDREAFLAHDADVAEALAACLQGLDFVHAAGAQLSQPTGGGLEEASALGAGQPVEALGDFRIVREVGRGGMGVVYEAEQMSLRRRVALKVLPFAATMDSKHLQRFHNEAQAAACLHHTNIVPIFSVGCERGIHFYAMQFIDGQPLSELIHQLRGLEKKAPTAGEERTVAYQPSPREADSTPRPVAERTPWTGEGRRGRDYYRKVAELGTQAAEALDHAHQLGIVHRDIKPGNLLLDGTDRLWITDFGLAHVQQREASLTVSGQMVGTPRYMSPEQALAKRVPIDHRSDVYSLGATLYELLTLQPAFPSENRHELLRQIVSDEPTRPRRLERAIPAELEIIVLKAMEKQPQDRYATAQELADDLRHWLLDQPIQARRPSVVHRVRKWGRRHKSAVRAGVAVLLMVLGMADYVGWTRHNQAMRRQASEQVVVAALEDSDDGQQKRRLPEALSSARRANGLLAGADVDEALRQRVRARLADLELLDRLENVRLEKMTAIKDGRFDLEGADVQYGQTFRDAGLDVATLPVEEAGERIRATTIAVELATVLDHWAMIRRKIRGEEDPGAKDLLRVARVADADAWRTKVREAFEKRDGQALRQLAASEEVICLSPATLHVLGFVLVDSREAPDEVEVFLRKAQRRHPNDFWLNANLSYFFSKKHPPQREESLRFAAVATALRPESPVAHYNLGNVLHHKGHLDEAIAEFREAIRIAKDFAEAHGNLGVALKDKGQLDEAIAEHRETIRIRKDDALSHYNLGVALMDKGRLDEAITEYREAIRINKDDAGFHNNLGLTLKNKGQMDEAITEYREAIRIDKDDVVAHVNLGFALHSKGQLDEAIAEYREVIRVKKDDALAHCNLGAALKDKGQLDEAIAEFHEAIRLNKDFAAAHVNLELTLLQKGQFRQSVEALRRSHELGSREPDWPHPTALWLRQAEQMAQLDERLPAVLQGKDQPRNAADRLGFAQICHLHRKDYAAAARFYREAFAEQPKLADDLNVQHRYNAAGAAAMAGCGQGKDAARLDTKERARLRQQALDWLRGDLKAYRQVMDKSAGKAGPAIAERMQHWLSDTDFAGVRGEEALGKLPEAERQAWHKLWQEVEALRRSAIATTKSVDPPKGKEGSPRKE